MKIDDDDQFFISFTCRKINPIPQVRWPDFLNKKGHISMNYVDTCDYFA
jgi:hypothetical protein